MRIARFSKSEMPNYKSVRVYRAAASTALRHKFPSQSKAMAVHN